MRLLCFASFALMLMFVIEYSNASVMHTQAACKMSKFLMKHPKQLWTSKNAIENFLANVEGNNNIFRRKLQDSWKISFFFGFLLQLLAAHYKCTTLPTTWNSFKKKTQTIFLCISVYHGLKMLCGKTIARNLFFWRGFVVHFSRAKNEKLCFC